MPHYTRLSKEQKLEVLQHVAQGKPYVEVARKYGVAAASIGYWRKLVKEHGEDGFIGSGYQRDKAMTLTEKQRAVLIKEHGEPVAQIEFDVWSDGSLSMWTHFNQSENFYEMKFQVERMRDHLDKFIKESAMCPFAPKQCPSEDP